MSSNAVQTKIDDYLAANWLATPIRGVDNDLDGPPLASLDPWIAVQYPGADESQASMGDPGNNVWREEGVIVVHIQVASGTGKATYLSLGDQMAALFRGKDIDGVHIRSVSPPNFREDVKAFQGNWYSLSMTIDYYHDIHA